MSLLPPPCDELTTNDPFVIATRVSPPGTTFERESWRVPAEGVTHLRVVIQPDKGGAPYLATLTSLTIR